LPDDNGIDRIVQLLKKSAEQNREKKRKERAPYGSGENGSGCAVVAVARHGFYCTALLCICPALYVYSRPRMAEVCADCFLLKYEYTDSYSDSP